MIALLVYILCALTSTACALLLWRAYRRSGARVLLWSTLAFGALAANNALLVVDLVVVPAVDLALVRALASFGSVGLLLFGLLWEDV
jgi:hypothetical protein